MAIFEEGKKTKSNNKIKIIMPFILFSSNVNVRWVFFQNWITLSNFNTPDYFQVPFLYYWKELC